MIDYFIFGDIDSRDYGIALFNKSTDDAPEIEQDEIEVPGRNGTIILSNHRYKNVSHVYSGIIYKGMEERLRAFRADISAVQGYHELSDTFNPEEFYIAQKRRGFTPTITSDRSKGKFEIAFDRKPQRFLRTGTQEIEIQSGGRVYNPTPYTSKPLIRVYGSGTLGVGAYTYTIAPGFAYVDIDSDIMDCYHGTDNANNKLTLPDGRFPEFEAGETGITYTGNITRVIITPRWWTL